VLDPSSPNGLTSQARLTTTYWRESPPTNLIVDRTRGLPLIGGVDHLGRQWTNTQLNIDPNTPITGQNVFIFVADRDGNPGTVESFLPEALAPQNPPSGAPRQAQLQLTLDTGILSTAGRALSSSFCTAFSVGQDTIPPTVASSVPAPDATNVPITSDVEVTFSEPVDPTSVVLGVPPTGTFDVSVLAGPNAIPVNGTVTLGSSQNSCMIVFRPAQAMPGRALVQVTVEGGTAAMPPAPPTAGIRDLVGNRLINPITGAPSRNRYVFTFRTGDGPELSNNPVAPEGMIFSVQNPTGLGVVEANFTDGREDSLFPQNEDGALIHTIAGEVEDMILGDFISTFPLNVIGNPPRDVNIPLPFQNGNPPCATPGAWCAPGAAVPNGLCQTINPLAPPPSQIIGNFLFVADPLSNKIHILNSNTFQILKEIPGVDPTGLGIDPSEALAFLYVSNADAGTLSAYDIARGADGLPLGRLIRHIVVESGPRGVAVQPGHEDILVCNTTSNSVSVISNQNLNSPNPVRKTIRGSVGPTPWDLAVEPRVLTGSYYAYITNRNGNSVSIYESGPPLENGFGRDDIIDVIADPSLQRPMGICESYQIPNIFPDGNRGGAWIANNGNGTVSHLEVTDVRIYPLPNPPPGYSRILHAVTGGAAVGSGPTDIVLNDPYFVSCGTPKRKQLAQQPPAPFPVMPLPVRGYVTNRGEGTITVFELGSGRTFATLPVGAAYRITGYYKQ
jgi:DNA-binding beta-propeller fold protein YncE